MNEQLFIEPNEYYLRVNIEQGFGHGTDVVCVRVGDATRSETS